MKKLSFCWCILLICCSSYAQNFTILGKVVDSATNLPLNGASVFCQNTTQGTTTDSAGRFFLRLPYGGYDMVVSYTGYDKFVTRISNTDEFPDTLQIALVQQENTLTEVAVVATNEVENGWEQYGDFMVSNFIGTTPNAAQCSLENPEALHFFYSKKRNRLKVTADTTLTILNYALGYKIHYQLDSFSYDYDNSISQYTGYPLFEEMDSTRDAMIQWEKNRARTYLGSRLHFMRSYYKHVITEEGFVLEKMDDDPESITGTHLKDPYDNEFYSKDSNLVHIDWKGHYRVSYKSVWPDPKFLKEFHLPADTRVQITLLNVKRDFFIERNGYFFDQYDVINAGYWAWKQLAEALPYDYIYR